MMDQEFEQTIIGRWLNAMAELDKAALPDREKAWIANGTWLAMLDAMPPDLTLADASELRAKCDEAYEASALVRSRSG